MSEIAGIQELDGSVYLATLAFLLDRQHADELPDTLDLEDVVAAYDDYLEDMRRRAAGSRAD
jgi:hypothetical protein